MDNPSLGKLRTLPLELRDHIYRMVYEDGIAVGGEIKLSIRSYYTELDKCPRGSVNDKGTKQVVVNARAFPRGPQHQLGITRTSRAIRNESLKSLFRLVAITCDHYLAEDVALSLGNKLELYDLSLEALQNWLRATPFARTIEGLSFEVGNLINDGFIGCWGLPNLRYPIFKGLLPCLASPITITFDVSIERWARNQTCKHHKLIHVPSKQALTRYNVSVESPSDAIDQISSNRHNMMAVWSLVLSLRDPKTVKSNGCCPDLNFHSWVEGLYSKLLQDVVDHSRAMQEVNSSRS